MLYFTRITVAKAKAGTELATITAVQQSELFFTNHVYKMAFKN